MTKGLVHIKSVKDECYVLLMAQGEKKTLKHFLKNP